MMAEASGEKIMSIMSTRVIVCSMWKKRCAIRKRTSGVLICTDAGGRVAPSNNSACTCLPKDPDLSASDEPLFEGASDDPLLGASASSAAFNVLMSYVDGDLLAGSDWEVPVPVPVPDFLGLLALSVTTCDNLCDEGFDCST